MNKKYHYVYRITNTKLNKHYYGTRSSRIEPSKDIGVKYFSSSSDIQFRDDQKNNPQNYKYIIVSEFNSREGAILLEIKLHSRFNVGANESFYNKARQTSTGFDWNGPYSEKTREKLRQAHLGNTYCLGNKLSEETKAKIKKAQQDLDYRPSEEFKEYLREVNTGVKVYHDPNTKENRRFKNIKDVPAGWVKGESHTKTAECPHCNKIGNKAAIHRWHFDNCKKKQ